MRLHRLRYALSYRPAPVPVNRRIAPPDLSDTQKRAIAFDYSMIGSRAEI